ncbi:MAG: hypothetical protein AAF346_17185 [Pseudomonadota bacterium]
MTAIVSDLEYGFFADQHAKTRTLIADLPGQKKRVVSESMKTAIDKTIILLNEELARTQ